MEIRSRQALKRNVDEKEYMKMYGGLGDANDNVSASPYGMREKVQNAIPGGAPGPARKEEEVYQ